MAKKVMQDPDSYRRTTRGRAYEVAQRAEWQRTRWIQGYAALFGINEAAERLTRQLTEAAVARRAVRPLRR